jgi:hypothetical protein
MLPGASSAGSGVRRTLARRSPDAPESKVATLSTESIVNPPQSFGAAEPCRSCGAPMAADQRYCLQCGERRGAMSSVLAGGPAGGPQRAQGQPTQSPAPGQPPSHSDASQQRSNTLTVIAGVGVLMLAMGVGVLIGRAGASKPTASPAQVISVATGQPGASTPTAAESFTSDWPAGRTGFTVQLQTLPQSGSQVSAVLAAKAAALAKGAKGVGALKSEEFSSLPSGNYVIYSGDYHKKAEAQKALNALKKSFPAASVIEVSSHGSSSAGSSSSLGSGSSGGVGNSLSKPAPPTVLESKPVKGQSFEQKSKNLPNVISTG